MSLLYFDVVMMDDASSTLPFESKFAAAIDPEELAEVYRMLVENSYFNGEVIVVDGGYSYK